MKNWPLLLILFSLTATAQDASTAATIYGQDDRQEVSDVDMSELSRGVVVAMPSQFTWKLPVVEAPSLEKRFRVCSSDRYASQPSVGSCTGMHIGDGLILTAAHCVTTAFDCEKFKWAFNYRSDVVGEVAGTLEMKEVYKCESVIATDKKLDVTLLKLEKAARKQKGLRLPTQPPLSPKVFAIGSPLGMPLKFSGMGQLVKADDGMATASLDTFHGNSGSPVMNEARQVIGILLGGGEDFVTTDSGCRESVVLDEKEHQESILLLNSLPDTFRSHIRKAQRKL